jgi:hypothetical protein
MADMADGLIHEDLSRREQEQPATTGTALPDVTDAAQPAEDRTAVPAVPPGDEDEDTVKLPRVVARRVEQQTLSEIETAQTLRASSPLTEAETLPLAAAAPAVAPAEKASADDTAAEPSPLATGEDPATAETAAVVAAMGNGKRSASADGWPWWRPRARKPQRKRRLLSPLLLVILSLGLGLPLIIGLAVGIQSYITYSDLRSHASDGVEHLMALKNLFRSVKSHPTSAFDADKLRQAQKELEEAKQSFQDVRTIIDHSPIIHSLSALLPQYRPEVTSARAAAQIGLDISAIGLTLVPAAQRLAPDLREPLLGNTSKPLVTQSMLDLLNQTIDSILPPLRDIEVQEQQLSLTALPLSDHQRTEVAQLLEELPMLEQALTQARPLLDAGGWLLGVDAPRTFVVQTMDRSELRPTGGFTGQYGELTINAGRIAPFSLKDISFIEYAPNSPTLGQSAPPAYRSWWPFANWGLRDSNLSADFPTSAEIAIQAYQHEVGHHVDGVIAFTPFFIEHILDILGPITVPGYNETITAQNLEDRLHYYQQDNAGIRKQEIVEHVNDPSVARKLFTARLAQMLMGRVRQASPDELLAIARSALYDLKTKDVQIYVVNAQVEDLLMRYGDAAQMDRSSTHDGLFIVQANLNATKASQYVRTLIHDVVTLDAAGGATHYLQLRLAYTATGPVYGYDAYRDYVRIYVPPTSKLLSGDGFDTGTPLCGGPLPACNATTVYPHDELMCPPGQYQPGAASPSLSDENPGDWHPLDTIGPPTNMVSDAPGRAMFGGWVVVPKNCTMTVTLSWYVPPLGNGHYSLLVQRQAGTFPELDLTILPPDSCVGSGIAGLHVDTLLTLDTLFTPRALSGGSATQGTCYPRVTV